MKEGQHSGSQEPAGRAAIIVHGGAGTMKDMADAREGRYREGLRAAAAAGARVLEAGGEALDAVVAAVVLMEDSGIFNAGLGSCLTEIGDVEMDAALMRGQDRGFGAVAGVREVANPVLLARGIMTRTPHCILGGAGAVRFARELGLPFREDFPSVTRRAEWERKRAGLPPRLPDGEPHALTQHLATLGAVAGEAGEDGTEDAQTPVGRRDTVGAAAVDAGGHVAAAVSTGGIWMKMHGRIGDSPLPGAGLWAVDGQGAAVATGTGEALMRVLICREVVDAMRGPGVSADAAAEAGISLLNQHFGPDVGGVIVVRPDGDLGFAFNTRGMGRAAWRPGMAEPAAAVWPGEEWDRALVGL
jgi:beta-aspartyl-peptidase (threonine type)